MREPVTGLVGHVARDELRHPLGLELATELLVAREAVELPVATGAVQVPRLPVRKLNGDVPLQGGAVRGREGLQGRALGFCEGVVRGFASGLKTATRFRIISRGPAIRRRQRPRLDAPRCARL